MMIRKIFFFWMTSIFFITKISYANIPKYIIKHSKYLHKKNLHHKILTYSKLLKSIPYGQPQYKKYDITKINSIEVLLDLLSQSEFTSDFDKLDCVTFLESLFALSFIKTSKIASKDYYNDFKKEFEANLKKIRYKNGEDNYFKRNHFTSIDWLPNNSHFLEDITKKIYPKCKIAYCHIQKFKWFLNYEYIKSFIMKYDRSLQKKTKDKIKTYFINKNYDYKVIKASSPYIPINFFLNNYRYFYEKLPNIGILFIVRPNWDIKDIIGTNLNISHMGLFFKDNGNLIFRHSTSNGKKGILDIDLQNYLEQYINSKTVKGISVIKIYNI